MSDRFFIDTNIFLYTFDQNAPEKARRSEDLISLGIETGKAVISFQVVQEFLNGAFRRLKPAMSHPEAELYLAMTLRPLLAVHSSYTLYIQALQINSSHSISWYDSLIVAAAIESDCGILYSEDLQHGRRFDSLVVRNPFL